MPPRSDPVAPRDLGAHRREVLLVSLCALFVGFFVCAELLGAKLWSFSLFGLGPVDLGLSGESFVATAGILAFPLTFILTDSVNEYFGVRVVRLFTFAAIGVNVVLQFVVQAAIRVPAVSFTPGIEASEIQWAYQLALGQSWAIVAASLVAFVVGQLLDVHVFAWLRRSTGGRMLWLRAQGSTVVSQLVDTFIVIFLAFVAIPALFDTGQMRLTGAQAFEISLTNYVYKFAIAVALTPLLYGVHALVDLYLGREQAHAMADDAHAR
jgi:queuosine precursor transporter